MKKERRLRLHDRLVHVGWIAGPEAHALAYWTMRLADEIADVARYEVAYRDLRELAWENVRPFDNSRTAVSSAYPSHVARFLARHEKRFPSKYSQCLREIRTALAGIRTVPEETGRIDQQRLAA